MIERGLGRDTVLVALGGGVVTDLSGFIAATFCRGIPFVSIPTTLVGMVDASIGGKVGVNTEKGKNLIGAFYSPHSLFIDLSLLDSLSIKEIQNGLSEIIKYGLIANPSLLSETVTMEMRVREGIKIKCKVIKHDPYEKGMRRILNFGHTVGHALEIASKHKLSHGEAIAIGMVVEGTLSGIDTAPFFKPFDIPLRWPKSIEVSEVLSALERDKKARAGKARFVLLDEIGKPRSFEGAYCTEVPLQRVEEALYSYPYC